VLALLAAAAVAAQPIPTDFDLASVVTEEAPPMVEVAPNVYTTDPETYNPDTPTPMEMDRINRGIEQRRIIYHVLNAADLGTTLYCLEIADNCREANPIYGQSPVRVVIGKVASAALYEWGLDRARDAGNYDFLRVMQYVHIGLLGGIVVWNASVIF